MDAVNLDFEAVALMGEYDDVLTEDDVVAVLSKKSHCVSATAKSAERATLSQPAAPRFPARGALPHFGRPRYLGPPPRARSTAG